MITFRSYQPLLDEVSVYNLWQHTLGRTWPVPQDIFHFITIGNPAYRSGDHIVALVGNDLIGFVGYQVQHLSDKMSSRGALLVLLVSPTYQRQGIGSKLHDQALTALKERGVEQVQIASGALFNFWAGVPLNLPTAWSFFRSHGWLEYERTFDLVCNLDGYTTPSWVSDRLFQIHITIDVATSEDIPAILAFESHHFPLWFTYYQDMISQNMIGNIVIAKDGQGTVVGSSFLRLPSYLGGARDLPWILTLGENTGGVGPLGVAERMRERGIGLALAAKVTELLQAQGIAKSYVGYTWLVNWYGRLGYSKWCEYYLSRRMLR